MKKPDEEKYFLRQADCQTGTIRAMRYMAPLRWVLEVYAPLAGEFVPYKTCASAPEYRREFSASVARFGGLLTKKS